MRGLIVIQNIERETAGLFELFAIERGLTVSVVHAYLNEPIPLPNCDYIYLILGGPMGVSDLSDPAYSWLNDEVALIQKLISEEIPYIGVCLGAQLLAFAAGGTVTPLLDLKAKKPITEIGWSKINVINRTIDPLLFFKIDEYFDAFQWHSDRIVLPSSSDLLGTSAMCREQIFKIRKKAIGLQFHLEVTRSDIERWIVEDHIFIKEALGCEGQNILKNGNDLYLGSSFVTRKQLIGNIFNSLEQS